MFSGHVPAAEIRRLLTDRSNAIGLFVPGMTIGLPGLGDDTDREAYEAYLIVRHWTTSVFASYSEA